MATRRRALTLLAAASLLVASCGARRTFLVVSVAAGSRTPRGIARIELTLRLGTDSAMRVLTESDGREILLPTDAGFQIQHGEGLITVTALAVDALGRSLDSGSATVTVVAGQTAGVTVPLACPAQGPPLVCRGVVAGDMSGIDLAGQDFAGPQPDLGGPPPDDLTDVVPDDLTDVVPDDLSDVPADDLSDEPDLTPEDDLSL